MTPEQEDMLKQAEELADKIPEAVPPSEPDHGSLKGPPAQAEEEPKLCVRCGLPYEQEILGVSEDDKKEYVRRVLANQMYTKTYTLFDGALVISISNLLNKDAMQIERLLPAVAADSEDLAKVRAMAIRLKGVAYLRQVGDKKYEVPELTDDTSVQDLLGIWDKMTAEMNEDLVVLLVQTLVHHFGYLNALAGSAFDVNFWKGAGYV